MDEYIYATAFLIIIFLAFVQERDSKKTRQYLVKMHFDLKRENLILYSIINRIEPTAQRSDTYDVYVERCSSEFKKLRFARILKQNIKKKHIGHIFDIAEDIARGNTPYLIVQNTTPEHAETLVDALSKEGAIVKKYKALSLPESF